jgi:hypothetical protein
MGLWEPGTEFDTAQRLLRAGRLAEAEAALALATAAPAERAALALLRGALAARRGDLETALSETGRSVQLALEEGEGLVALAAVQLGLGRNGFARPPAERAGRIAADFAPGHAALAAAWQRSLEVDAALAAIRAAAVAAALHNGLRADTPGFRAVAAELGARLLAAGKEAAARPFQAAGQG